MKEIIVKLEFIKMNFSSVEKKKKTVLGKLDGKPQIRNKYLQKTHLIKNNYPRYQRSFKTQY